MINSLCTVVKYNMHIITSNWWIRNDMHIGSYFSNNMRQTHRDNLYLTTHNLHELAPVSVNKYNWQQHTDSYRHFNYTMDYLISTSTTKITAWISLANMHLMTEIVLKLVIGTNKVVEWFDTRSTWTWQLGSRQGGMHFVRCQKHLRPIYPLRMLATT